MWSRLLRFTSMVALVTSLVSLSVGPVRAQQADEPSFSFEPSSLTVKPGDLFITPIILNTAGQSVQGAGAKLIYDASIVKILSVDPGTLFADYPIAAFDNKQGLVSISGIVSSPNESFNGKDAFAKITWQLLQPEATTVSFDFVPGSTTDSNIAVQTGNGDILSAVGALQITPGTITTVAQNTTVITPNNPTTTNQVVTAQTTETTQPVTGPVATTILKVKIMAANLLNSILRAVNSLFGRATVDPYEPIKASDPQTTLQTTQPDSSVIVQDQLTGASTVQATPTAPNYTPLILIGLGLVGIIAVLIWMLIKRRREQVVIDTVYQPPMPQNTNNPPPLP